MSSPTTRVRLHLRWISSSTPSDRQVHLRKHVPSTVARRPVYHYRRRVRLLPTTTREQLLPLRPLRERLLPLHRTELDPPRKRTLQRYNPETIVRERMLVTYEMHPLSAPCPGCLSLPCHRLVGHPESGSTPPSFARICTLLLCIGISIELPEPKRCRGTILLSLTWHPFSFPPR